MAVLDEIGSILFKGSSEAVDMVSGAPSTTIIYGVALGNSVDGFVEVQLDDAIYAADDIEDDDEYEYVTLDDSDNDITGINEDEDIEENEEDVVYWTPEEDEATEYDI